MSIKALIVDDESDAQDVLEILLSKIDNITIIDKASNVHEAVKSIKEHSPDVVFLDVEMPKIRGFELVNFFEEINFHIIFVTAYDKYAIKAFEINAIDYLLKPVNRQKLKDSVEKVNDRLHVKNQLKTYQNLIKDLEEKESPKVVLNEVGKKRVCTMNDIIAIEAQGTYSKIHLLHEDKPMLMSKNIGYFESFFEENHPFFRSHKSWYINSNHINGYAKGRGIIELSNNILAKLSKYKKSDFESYLMNSQ